MKLIIFTTCKPFKGDDSWRQEQAIKSWIELKGIDKKIIIIEDDEYVKDICNKYNLIHRPDVKNFIGVPYLHSMLEIGANYALEDDYLLWTNSDMIYFDDMIKNILAFDKMRKNNKKKYNNFCLVGGRVDWHNPKIINDFNKENFIKNMNINNNNTHDVCQESSTKYECSNHPLCGIDYTIHSRTTFINKIDKHLVVAGTRHDMMLVGAAKENNCFTCNITNTNFVLHQNHGYPWKKHYYDLPREHKIQQLINNNNKCFGRLSWINECITNTIKIDNKIFFQ